MTPALRDKVAQAEAEAIRIKAACYCHALPSISRPCYHCVSYELIKDLIKLLVKGEKND